MTISSGKAVVMDHSHCPETCEIPARTLPPCDLEWGHPGDMHSNAGDGFYARNYETEHRRRQRDRAQGDTHA